LSSSENSEKDQGVTGRQPVFLLPRIVTIICGLLVAVHLLGVVLGPAGQSGLTLWLGYVPLRFVAGAENPVDWLPLIWTPVTHALLHANWEHLVLNVAWLAIFGTPVARRYGPVATVIVFLASAAAGAAAFTVTNLLDGAFLIGASGGVAGLTGAAMRFIFQPVVVGRDPVTGDPVVLGRRLAGIADVFRNPRSRWFTIIWIALNAAVPVLPLLGGGDVAIAWQAHLGGFVAGFLMAPLFERRR
jgi:membrane associated rhomboid family serine protease